MHRFWLSLSFDASVERTLSSIREASRYFGTERITLMAHRVPFLLSYASTTLPNVPCPRSFTIVSIMLVSINWTKAKGDFTYTAPLKPHREPRYNDRLHHRLSG